MTGTGSDTNYPVRKYYFGKNGNGFRAVTDKSANGYWELAGKSTSAKSQWSTSDTTKGDILLSYVNSSTSIYFNSADLIGMKTTNISDDVYQIGSWDVGSGSYTKTTVYGAYMWPLSISQLVTSIQEYGNVTSSMTKNGLFMMLQGNPAVWTRSFAGKSGSRLNAWSISTYSIGADYVDSELYFSNAFYLDLQKVLCSKAATKNASSESITYIGTKISEDLKFLINAGNQKASSFTINKKGEYTGAVTTTINGGTNYISEIIYDSTGKSLYYGNLGTVSSSSGSVELTIPDGIASGTYTLAVFEEEKCAAYKTDYACAPVYFSFTV